MEDHKFFPIDWKRKIFTFLACNQHQKFKVMKIPKPLILLVIIFFFWDLIFLIFFGKIIKQLSNDVLREKN